MRIGRIIVFKRAQVAKAPNGRGGCLALRGRASILAVGLMPVRVANTISVAVVATLASLLLVGCGTHDTFRAMPRGDGPGGEVDGGADAGTVRSMEPAPDPVACSGPRDCDGMLRCLPWAGSVRNVEAAAQPLVLCDAPPIDCTGDAQCAAGETCHEYDAGCAVDAGRVCGPPCPASDCAADADCGAGEVCHWTNPAMQLEDNSGVVREIGCAVQACGPACDATVHGCKYVGDERVCDQGPCGQQDRQHFCQADGSCGYLGDCTLNNECTPDLEVCLATDLPPARTLPFCVDRPCETVDDCGGRAPYCLGGYCRVVMGACL